MGVKAPSRLSALAEAPRLSQWHVNTRARSLRILLAHLRSFR